MLILGRQGFKLTSGEEQVKAFESLETDSGKPLFRCFCSNCGANLWAKTPLNHSIISICAGTQDQIADWKPSKEQYCRNRHDWLDPVRVDGNEIATHSTHPMLERR